MSSTPFQIPPPPVAQQRVIVQPSLHARGARPYIFTGAIDEWHAPGADVSTRNSTTRAAVDAAWLCERVLGPARTAAVRWPGVTGARERAVQFAGMTNPPLSNYQGEGAAFLAERDYACLFDQMGLGKQHPVDTRILTPDGWWEIGALQPGDKVIGSAGRAVTVTGVFPQGVKPSYRVRFSDRSSVEAGPEHLWTVLYLKGGRTWDELVLTTEQLRLRPTIDLHHEKSGRDSRLNLALTPLHLPMLAAPVEFASAAPLPLPPYLAGQLLGNGSMIVSTPKLVTSIRDWTEVQARLQAEGVTMSTPRRYANVVHVTLAGIVGAVRDLGINVHSRDKFIPEVYLRARVPDRITLLQALMDTDGSVSATHNRVIFHSTSYRLALGVQELVEGLGGIASVRQYDRAHEDKPTDYQVRVRLPAAIPPFSIQRKASRYQPSGRLSNPVRTVVAVEYVRDVESVCISVDAPDRLYATEHAILTHNTAQALVAAEARLALSVVPTTETPVVLIVCPALAKYSWQREIARWVGYDAAIIDGLRVTEVPRARYVIANYDILYGKTKRDAAGVVHDLEHLTGWGGAFAQQGFAIVILDEAHMLRGRQSRRTQAVKKMCKRVPIVWALTGTPIPNYVRDIWAMIDVVSDGLFGYSYWSWAKKYAQAALGQYGWKDTGAAYPEELSARLGYFCLGRSAASVALELPEKRREVLKLDVTMTATTRHEGVVAMASKASFVASALRATARAKRPAAIEQIVEAVQAGQKVVAYTYMREQADEIAKAVKAKVDAPVFAVHGDMTPQGRDQQAGVFRDTAGAAAFVATIDSVGVAISLVGADLVLYCDLVPEPWKLLQSEKRAHRRGSSKRVIVRYLIGVGTLDEGVVETVIDKLAAIEASLGGEADQTELVQQFGSNVRSDESIIDGLFARLVGGPT